MERDQRKITPPIQKHRLVMSTSILSSGPASTCQRKSANNSTVIRNTDETRFIRKKEVIINVSEDFFGYTTQRGELFPVNFG